MFVIAFFKESNAPVTGLSPTVDIWRVDDDTLVVDDGAMTELGASGIYYYDFSAYDETKTYISLADGQAGLDDRYVLCTCSYRDPETDLNSITAKLPTNYIMGASNQIDNNHVINFEPIIPNSIDLADTVTVRLTLAVMDGMGTVPLDAQITPGIIYISRKAKGSDTWTSILSGSACLDIDGLIYYDEIFDSGSGYAEGDTIWIRFANQSVTINGNVYQFTSSNNSFYTYIRESQPFDSNVVQISGDTTAADNLESQYDETGLSGDTFPATQEQLSNIANTGAAINKVVAGVTLNTGSEANDYTDTRALDGTYHEITPDGGVISVDYNWNIGATGVPVSVTMIGRLYDPPPVNDDIIIQAYDWVALGWTQVGVWDGVNSAVDSPKTVILFSSHVGTGANAGEVDIRFVASGIAANTVLYLDLLYCSYSVVASPVGYANGTIWVDTLKGVAGTAVNINGTADNPVLTWADALSLSTSLGIYGFNIANGSTITLSDDSSNFSLMGKNWTLDLGSQVIANISVEGAHVTGTGTGAMPHFTDCILDFGGGGDFTVAPGMFFHCGLAGDLVISSAGTSYFDCCYSGIAGTATPSIDFGSGIANTNINFRHYSGGIEIKNIGANGTDKMSLEGHGQLVLNANCAGGTIAIRGHFMITDNVGGGFAGTLSVLAMFDHNTIIDDILVDVTGLNGDVMRGNDGANTVVPDIAGTAATLHGITDGKVDAVQSDATAIKNSTDNLPGDPASETNVDATETKVDTLLTRLSAVRAGYLDNLSVGAVALEASITAIKGAGWTDENLTTIDGLVDTLITRLTAIRAGYLDNLSAGAVALEATLTAMKGAGWTIETLKAIKDAIDAIAASDATLDNQTDMIDKLKGLMSKDYTLSTAVGNFDPANESNEAIRDRGDAAWTSDCVQGSNAITVTVQDGDANNIVECSVEIWDSAGTTFYERQVTNASGQTVHNLDDGTYTVKMHKATYSFSEQTLVVTAIAAVTYTGTAFDVGTPSAPDTCRCYDYIYDQEGSSPVSSITATAEIVTLPLDSGTVLHVGSEVTGTYSAVTGLLYWDIVQGATVKFHIPGTGICGTCVVPSTATARISDQTLT